MKSKLYTVPAATMTDEEFAKEIYRAIEDNRGPGPKKLPPKPSGSIITPIDKTQTSTIVYVSGETENIQEGQHLWLIVEKPDLRLCWPKYYDIKPNTEFKAAIFEEGREGRYNLSLYAVNDQLNTLWRAWLNSRKYKGLSMPPANKRLHSVSLIKEGETDEFNTEFYRIINKFEDDKVGMVINDILVKLEKEDPGSLTEIKKYLEDRLEKATATRHDFRKKEPAANKEK